MEKCCAGAHLDKSLQTWTLGSLVFTDRCDVEQPGSVFWTLALRIRHTLGLQLHQIHDLGKYALLFETTLFLSHGISSEPMGSPTKRQK